MSWGHPLSSENGGGCLRAHKVRDPARYVVVVGVPNSGKTGRGAFGSEGIEGT